MKDAVLAISGRIERNGLPQQRVPRAPQALKDVPVSGGVSTIVAGARSVSDTLAHAVRLFARKLQAGRWFVDQHQRFRGLAIGPDDSRGGLGVEGQLHIERRDGGTRIHRGSAGADDEDVTHQFGGSLGAHRGSEFVPGKARERALSGRHTAVHGATQQKYEHPIPVHRLPPAGTATNSIRGTVASPSTTQSGPAPSSFRRKTAFPRNLHIPVGWQEHETSV